MDARRARRLRWLLVPAVLVLVVIVVRALLMAPFSIPSGSMEPTLEIGDRVVVNRLVDAGDLRRGDVVVFDAAVAFNLGEPERGVVTAVVDAAGGLVGQSRPTDYVKRVIGLPGDRVRCCANDGRIEVNGIPIDEPYLPVGEAPSNVSFDVTLAADRFWVMGDHRSASGDSRSQLGSPGGGAVPGEDIIGKVWVRYWPLDRLGSIG